MKNDVCDNDFKVQLESYQQYQQFQQLPPDPPLATTAIHIY
jgi:hypothetical protein